MAADVIMVLNAETGHTSPRDKLPSIAVRKKSGTGSYFEVTDYISFVREVMKGMKTMGNWDSYLSYEK